MKRTIIIVITVCFSFSCSPTLYQHNNTEMEKARIHWVGESKASLVMSWGSPTAKRSDLKGAKYMFTKEVMDLLPGLLIFTSTLQEEFII